jgi:uncharacterized MAPEG superfamily protein
MPIALWCVLVAAVLPIVAVMPAKLGGEFDNSRPRDPDYWRAGFRARAAGAMANGFEAFPLFAVAVIVGLEWGGSAAIIDVLAAGFVLARIGYTLAYWGDRPSVRSLLWTVGLVLAVAIFLSPLWSPAG